MKTGSDLDAGWVQDTSQAEAPILSLYRCMQRQHQPGCVTHPSIFIKFLLKHYPKNKTNKLWLVRCSYVLLKCVLLSIWNLTVWLHALWHWKQKHRRTGIRDSREKLNWSGYMKVLWPFLTVLAWISSTMNPSLLHCGEQAWKFPWANLFFG